MMAHQYCLYKIRNAFLSGSLFITLLCLLLSGSFTVFAQSIDTNAVYQDTGVAGAKILKDTIARKKFWRAGGELMLAEITPWVIDEYIRNVDYTKISWHTVGYNINPKNWEWDGDGFTTNQFGHPYHGSFYFNAFRTNGYNFWQSSYATCAGSYLWETFAENQPPAPNDFINTSFGGIVLGEMVYRMANRIVNNRTRGLNRKANEVLGFLVNPMNGMNRLLDKKWGRPVSINARDTTPLHAEFDIGVRKFKANNIDNSFGLYGRVRLLYGSKYDNYKTPFSNIFINLEAGRDDSSLVNIATIYGSLYGWKIKDSSLHKHMLVVTANYDFIRNEAFFYSAQSVRLSLNSDFRSFSKISISTSIGGAIVLLAAVPDEYEYKGRYYDYCMGTGFNGNFNINVANVFSGSLNYRGGWFKTVNGNASHYFLHTVNAELRYNLLKRFSICAEPGYYSLRGNYYNYPDVNKSYPYIKFSARYFVNIN